MRVVRSVFEFLLALEISTIAYLTLEAVENGYRYLLYWPLFPILLLPTVCVLIWTGRRLNRKHRPPVDQTLKLYRATWVFNRVFRILVAVEIGGFVSITGGIHEVGVLSRPTVIFLALLLPTIAVGIWTEKRLDQARRSTEHKEQP